VSERPEADGFRKSNEMAFRLEPPQEPPALELASSEFCDRCDRVRVRRPRWARSKFLEYPAVSRAKARKRARHAAAAIDDGRDPAGEQHAAKARPTDTVAALMTEYVAKHVRVKQRGSKEEERVLNVDVLTRRDVRALVAPIVDRGSPIMANRVLAVVRRMLKLRHPE
jgi:hypothetical protein